MKTIKKKIKTRQIPRKLSLVKFDFTDLPSKYHDRYPFIEGASYIFIGEIVNMPEHCVVASLAGEVYFGYHSDNFVELQEHEI
jgi:hypothetical protein